MKTLGRLVENLNLKRPLSQVDSSIEIKGVECDSRKVGPGSVFVAIKGTKTDGSLYIQDALKAGASAIICEEIPENTDFGKAIALEVKDSAEALGFVASAFYDYPSRKLKLIGVTGTNGKTTIATLLYESARLRGHKAGLLSTVVNKIGDESVESTHTTPDPLELNSLLARMVEEGCTFAAMEVSSHAAAQKRIAGLDFDGAIFTNLTRDHLDYHKTFHAYLLAKKSFFDGLKKEAFALVNIDDPNGRVMVQNTKAKIYTYSVREEADFIGKIVENRFDGLTLALNGKEVDTLFSGRFNAQNLTAVYGAGLLCGVSPMEMCMITSALKPVAGRFQCFRARGITAIVDYAHTPDALENVLGTISDILRKSNSRGRIITVFGAGGDRDHGKRPQMGSVANFYSDISIVTSDNPRNEKPEQIINDILEGFSDSNGHEVMYEVNRAEAITKAIAIAEEGDVVLVAGKGHEDYQVIGNEKHHFDDREQVCKALGIDNKPN